MCTLFIYKNDVESKWPLLLAANRDEYLNRPFKTPGLHWKEYPSIFAGKDCLKGGSWIGINKHYLCAIMLNRKNSNSLNFNSSRGNLVIEALKYRSAKEAIKRIEKKDYNKYNYFNFFVSDIRDSFWIKNDFKHFSINVIPPGYSMLDNFELNNISSKKQFIYKSKFNNYSLPIPEKNNYEDWKRLLFSKTKYKSQENTAIYNLDKKKNYGTLCSSIILIPNKKIINSKPIWLYHSYKYKKKNFKNLYPYKFVS